MSYLLLYIRYLKCTKKQIFLLYKHSCNKKCLISYFYMIKIETNILFWE